MHVLSHFSHVQLFCDPMDDNPPCSSIHGILSATILGWVAMTSSRESSQSRDQTHVSCISCIAGRFFTNKPPMGKPKEQYRYKLLKVLLWQGMNHLGRDCSITLVLFNCMYIQYLWCPEKSYESKNFICNQGYVIKITLQHHSITLMQFTTE